tara:strand:+ start:694 stop:1935 length:1242 start_codon:yes stop_codon:yes gene_type:complete
MAGAKDKAEDLQEEEEEEEECEKCVPGAPAWMSTFADMATLLMAFFVLILSFAEMNVPKFKQITGSLKNSFGVQRIVPVVEQPKGTTVLSMNFSPSPARSPTNEVTSDTDDVTKPELKVPTDDKQSEGSDKLQEGDQDREGLGGDNENDTAQEADKKLAKALSEIAEEVDIDVKMVGGRVAVDLKAEEASPAELVEKLSRIAKAIEISEIATDQKAEEVLFAGISANVAQLISAVSKIESQMENKGGAPQDKESFAAKSIAEKKAETSAEKLKVALSQQIQNGAIDVERRSGKVFVTLGAGGAFESGSAELTGKARQIINKLTKDGMDKNSSLTITGHTDNVPIANFKYEDNWELAAARASSVARAVERLGVVKKDKIKIISQGENKPVASNNTRKGREKNRRIEIEIDYEKS